MTRRDRVTVDLFEMPRPAAPIAASMDYRLVVAKLVREMLDQASRAGKYRYAIAAEMSRLADKEISKYMLDAYSAANRDEHNIPAWLMPLLETACSSHDYSSWLAEIRGGRLMVGRDALTAELGRISSEKNELAEREKAVKNQLRRARG